jgi:hypothetical protein
MISDSAARFGISNPHHPCVVQLPEQVVRPSAIQFTFESDVPLAEAEMSLHLAMFAIEGFLGRARVCRWACGPALAFLFDMFVQLS